MKTDAEVKRSMRCSEETMAGDVSMCAAVSVTKNKKRPRKADKPSKKEKRSEEKKKRSKKRIEKVEKQAAGDGFIDIKKQEKRTKMMRETGGGMTKLSQELLDYLRTKEVMGLLATEAPLPLWAKRMGGALFDLDKEFADLKEEIAAEFQENREFDAHVLYQYRTYGDAYAEIIKRTDTEENNNKKKLVTLEINNQALMGHYLSNEVWSYVMSIRVSTFEDAVNREMDTFDEDGTEGRRLATRIRHIENQANLLRQYRTNGQAVLQYEVTDDERDVEEV